jgi:hypothetical protein
MSFSNDLNKLIREVIKIIESFWFDFQELLFHQLLI